MKSKLLLLVLLFFRSLPIVAGQEDVRVYSEQEDDGGIAFYADNDFSIPVYVFIEFDRLRNLITDTDPPFGFSLEPGATRTYLFSLTRGNGTGGSAYTFRFRHAWGDPTTAQPDEDYLYTFPYAHGTKQELTQGFNGNFSHRNENSYALDFDLPKGTEVFAARAGLVIEVKEDSNIGGAGAQYGEHGNFVLILHDDGTFGNYVHLQQNAALVEPGDSVQTGQLIAYSGNTGQSTGPHLHFDVRIPQLNGRMQSIPIRLRGIDGEAVFPEENSFYYSSHSGGAAFPVSYGADLRNEDFADYRGDAGKANTIDIRTEQVDNSYMLFIGNGFDYAVEATVTLQLRNMSTTVPGPITIRPAAGEELFLTILRPLKGTNNSSYRSSISYRRN